MTASGRSGLTLVELMLVMGLLAVVLGLGLGSFATMNPGARAAVGLVEDVLRTAHNTAVVRAAPARVLLDRGEGTLVAEGMQVIGTWHFEGPELAGVDGMDGVFVGMDATLAEDGFLGRALSFAGAPRGAYVEFPVQEDPIYDLRKGFAVELALRPDDLAGARLLGIGDAFEAETTSTGAVRARFHRLEIDALGVPRRGGAVSVESEPGVLRPGRWTRLRFLYDQRAFRVLADGVEVAVTFSEEPVWRVEGPLRIGGGPTPLPGAVDQLVISAVLGEEVAELPPGVSFGKQAPARIELVAGGALDPARHPEPVLVPLVFEDGREHVVRVGLYGTVE